MKKSDKILILSIALLIILQAGLIGFFWQQKNYQLNFDQARQKASKGSDGLSEKSNIENKEKITGTKENSSVDFVYGGILPHHLVAEETISRYLKELSSIKYETFVLIGPNHFNRGSRIITSQKSQVTADGELAPDLELSNRLNLTVEEEPFQKEHSISALTDKIKKNFPQAKFVPIIIESMVSKVEAESLADKLASRADLKKTLVLASVDFSHYLSVNAADFHDEASRAAILNFDFDRIYGLEIDSPPSVYVLLKYLENIGARRGELRYSTNSGRIIPASADNTTSHNFFVFRSGAPTEEKYFSALFFGDMMLDRYVAQIIRSKKISGLMSNIAGEENRFFRGTDLISANLEGAVTKGGAHYPPVLSNDFAFAPEMVREIKKYGFNFFNIANNHLSDQGKGGTEETRKILDEIGLNYSGCQDRETGICSSKILKFGSTTVAMIGFSSVYGSLDQERAGEIVRDAKTKADFVIVNMHWGKEYAHAFSQTQSALAHYIIEAGADIIIGHHPHVIQGMEIYKNRPIFYSLGNFIFDQYFSTDTQEGLAVGLFVKGDGMSAHLFPLVSRQSIPGLAAGEHKERILSNLAAWSSANPGLKNMIKEGAVKIHSLQGTRN